MPSGLLGKHLLTANTYTSLFVAPARQVAVVNTNFCNFFQDAEWSRIRLAISAGPVPAAEDWLEYDYPLTPNSILERTGLLLSPGEHLVARSTTDQVTVRTHGYTEIPRFEAGRFSKQVLTRDLWTTAYVFPVANLVNSLKPIPTPTITLALCNTTGVPVKVRIAIGGGMTPNPADYYEYDTVLPANGVIERTGIVGSPGERLFVAAAGPGVTARSYGFIDGTAVV